jgi:hypothetical protein
MQIHKSFIVVGLLIAFAIFVGIVANAEEASKQIKVTFDKAVQIPGQVLAPGTYTFQLGDPDAGPNIVEIFNDDESVLYAMLPTISAQRPKATTGVSVTLAESQVGKPEALLTWFYPGSLIGHEFVYSKQHAQEIAHEKQKTFVGNQPVSNLETAGR